MKTIGIIAGISGKVITKEVQKCGYKALVISGRANDAGMDIADISLVEDLRNKEIILAALKRYKVEAIILGTGHILAFELVKYLQDNGIKISVDPVKSLIAKDKHAYKRELEKYGFLTPKFAELTHDENAKEVLTKHLENIGLPCVIKSTIDTMYPQKANTGDEYFAYINEVQSTGSPVLIEQYVAGIDTTVPVASSGVAAKAIMVSYYSKAKSCKLKGFEDISTENRLPAEVEEKLKSYAEEVTKTLGTVGMTRLDIIVDNNFDFYILECNSVMVTGVHPNQIEYGREFLEKENINFASITVETALKRFGEI